MSAPESPQAPSQSVEAAGLHVGADLSGGTISTLDRAQANLGLKEHSHRIGLQRSVTNSALTFVALLFMVAVVYGAVILYLLVDDPTRSIHWHASILVAAFVVPPTVVLVAVLRSVYGATEDEKNQSLLPVIAMFKDTAVAIAGMFKKG